MYIRDPHENEEGGLTKRDFPSCKHKEYEDWLVRGLKRQKV